MDASKRDVLDRVAAGTWGDEKKADMNAAVEEFQQTLA